MVTKLCLVDTGFHAEGIPRVSLLGNDSLSGYDMLIVDWGQAFRGWLTHNARQNCVVVSKDLTGKYWDIIRTRNQEISDLARRGGILVCILRPVEEYVDCNNGKVSSLNWLPSSLFSPGTIIPQEGRRFSEVDGHPFTDLVNAFRDELAYCALFKSTPGFPFLFTEDESGIVGVMSRFGDGYIVFMPGFNPEIEEGLSSSAYTDRENQYVKKYLEALTKAMDNIKKDGLKETPSWVEDLALPTETRVATEIKTREEQIRKIQEEINQLRNRLGDSKSWRQLVYERDEALSRTVRRSMELLGFRAVEMKSSKGELGRLFQSPEGMVLCKVEGTDNAPIDKDQLLELFRTSADEMAQRDEEISALLVGNAFRLQPLSQRKEQFTDSVRKIARRHNLGLITSRDLYDAISYALSHPEDEEFKAQCRSAFIAPTGETIRIPRPPS
jgi:hypothetical protein